MNNDQVWYYAVYNFLFRGFLRNGAICFCFGFCFFFIETEIRQTTRIYNLLDLNYITNILTRSFVCKENRHFQSVFNYVLQFVKYFKLSLISCKLSFIIN